MPGQRQKNTYMLLGIGLGFFGFPGVHNLYAGHTGRGVTQLALTIVSCYILWIPIYIWTFVEALTVTTDGEGNPMS
jgi:TM2 domain-containing membrane protein YozV